MRTVTHKYLGVSHRNDGFIFINVRHHTSLEQLRDTIIHELVHYRFGYLRHGRNFDKRIKLIKTGKVFKPRTITHREFSFCADCFGEPCYCNRIKGYDPDTGIPIIYLTYNDSKYLVLDIKNFCCNHHKKDTSQSKIKGATN